MPISQNDIKQKIKKLREFWYDDDLSLKWVDGVEKRLRGLIIKEKLAESKALSEIVKDARDRIRLIDIMLVNDEEMTELNRKLLIREKKVYNFFIDRLDGTTLDQQFVKVGKLLDDEMRACGLLKDGLG